MLTFGIIKGLGDVRLVTEERKRPTLSVRESQKMTDGSGRKVTLNVRFRVRKSHNGSRCPPYRVSGKIPEERQTSTQGIH